MEELKNKLGKFGQSWLHKCFAKHLDSEDMLAKYRERFIIPKNPNGTDQKEAIYFCGNSLGLQPKSCKSYIEQVLSQWGDEAVEGWFSEKNPWVKYDVDCRKMLSKIIGANEDEVSLMNSLTVNIHAMLSHFYRPDFKNGRYKILMEKGFPSDLIAVIDHLELRGFDDPTSALILVDLNDTGDETISDKICSIISEKGNEIALVFLEGVHYLRGSLLDMELISRVAKSKSKGSILVGFDLAHSVGNVNLELNNWEVDFAVFCTYKYLNSGPGGIGGCFVHSKHFKSKDGKRMGGWWGQGLENRFQMNAKNEMAIGASGFQISTPSIILLSTIKASLAIYDEVGMEAFVKKSKLLTGYLEALLLEKIPHHELKVITPSDPNKRGCQLTLEFKSVGARNVLKMLANEGVICDFREPGHLRVAPNPLYNSFIDVFNFVETLHRLLSDNYNNNFT